MLQNNKFRLFLAGLVVLKFDISGGLSLFKSYEEDNIKDKTILITGGSDGIGLESVKSLLDAKRVIVASRDRNKIKSLLENHKNLRHMTVDLSNLRQVKQFCDDFKIEHKNVDILINNAAVYTVTEDKKTIQGFELNFGVNYLSHALITLELLPIIRENGKIINVSSKAHYRVPDNVDPILFLRKGELPYSRYDFYPISKFTMILFSTALKERIQKRNIQVYSLHPGLIMTNLLLEPLNKSFYFVGYLLYPLLWYFTKTAYQGSRTTTFLAKAKSEKLINGAYYENLQIRDPLPSTQDLASADELLDKTQEYLQKTGYLSQLI